MVRANWMFALGLVALACGGDRTSPPTTEGPDAGELKPLLPWTPGRSWTYQVTDADGVTTKVTTVGDEVEPVGLGPNAEELAYRVVTSKQDGKDKTVSWQAEKGDTVVRYREQSYDASSGTLELETYWDPPRLHADGSAKHTKDGATWSDDFTEIEVAVDADGNLGTPQESEKSETWQVLAADVEVEVPAKTYSHAVLFQKASSGKVKRYWYVRGVGKVKEEGDSQTEELVSTKP